MSHPAVRAISLATLICVFAGSPLVVGQSAAGASSQGSFPAASQARSDEVRITGTVTCAKYVYSKPERKGFTVAEAIRLCASQGYSYVIVSGKDVYPLEGDRNQLAKLAGEKVTVTGRVDTDQPLGPKYTYHATVDATVAAAAAK